MIEELFLWIALSQQCRQTVQIALVVALCLYSVIAGGRPEKWVMVSWVLIVHVLARLLDRLLFGAEASVYSAERILITSFVDVSLFLAWLIIGLMANRLYIAFAAGAQFVAASAILFYDPDLPYIFTAFAFASSGGPWFALAAITGGFIAHYRRFRSGQDYPDWRWQVARARISTA